MRKLALITSTLFMAAVLASGFASIASAECAGHQSTSADISTHSGTMTQTAQTPVSQTPVVKPKTTK